MSGRDLLRQAERTFARAVNAEAWGFREVAAALFARALEEEEDGRAQLAEESAAAAGSEPAEVSP